MLIPKEILELIQAAERFDQPLQGGVQPEDNVELPVKARDVQALSKALVAMREYLQAMDAFEVTRQERGERKYTPIRIVEMLLQCHAGRYVTVEKLEEEASPYFEHSDYPDVDVRKLCEELCSQQKAMRSAIGDSYSTWMVAMRNRQETPFNQGDR